MSGIRAGISWDQGRDRPRSWAGIPPGGRAGILWNQSRDPPESGLGSPQELAGEPPGGRAGILPGLVWDAPRSWLGSPGIRVGISLGPALGFSLRQGEVPPRIRTGISPQDPPIVPGAGVASALGDRDGDKADVCPAAQRGGGRRGGHQHGCIWPGRIHLPPLSRQSCTTPAPPRDRHSPRHSGETILTAKAGGGGGMGTPLSRRDP